MGEVIAVDDQQRALSSLGHRPSQSSQIATMVSAMDAELLLANGPIYTMDPLQPYARHLAVDGGRIVACGSQPLDELRSARTRVIDLAGRAVVPGFVDAHVHFGSFALAQTEVDLDTAPTLADGLRLLQAAGERLAPGAWLRGRGWDRNRWGRLPTSADLDSALGDRPVALSSHDGHALWLSSAALRALGLDRHVADPAGGVIERTATGEPSGVLFENARDLVRGRIPQPTEAELRAAIVRSLPLAAAAGLTGIHNLEDERSRRAFGALEAADQLTLRVYHGIPRGDLGEAAERGLYTGAGSEWLRIGPVKLFSDGALGSGTAHVLEPYEGRLDGYCGVATMQPDELSAAMLQAADARLDVAVHAIGDAAVRSVLDVYTETRAVHPPLSERMLRIEHGQLIHPADVPRLASLGVVASMQPIHATADWRTADNQWGARARHGYAWRAVLEAGATLAFGTDAPVERIEPLFSLYAATTRLDPQGEPAGGWYPAQCLSLEDAVRAYTSGSAVAERAAERRGRLRPSLDADLVVLSPDPFALEPSALLDTRIELTLVGGRITYDGGRV